MASRRDPNTASTSLDHGQSLLTMDKAEDIWMCVKNKVSSALCGHNVTAVPHLRDAYLFRPFCVIGKRVERSLRLGKVRSLFPLGPLQELLDNREDLPEASLQKDGPVRCDFLYEESLDGVGRVRVQVNHIAKESAVCPLAPHRQLALKDNLPWLDSVHRLYLVSQAHCSSDARLRLLGTERRRELKLGPNTPLAFSCLRLSVSPSGLVEVCNGWENSYLHPRARWVGFNSPDYHSLTAERLAEPKTIGLLSQFAFNISHRPTIPPPSSVIHSAHSPNADLQQVSTEYQEEQEISKQSLLPGEEEEEEGSS